MKLKIEHLALKNLSYTICSLIAWYYNNDAILKLLTESNTLITTWGIKLDYSISKIKEDYSLNVGNIHEEEIIIILFYVKNDFFSKIEIYCSN